MCISVSSPVIDSTQQQHIRAAAHPYRRPLPRTQPINPNHAGYRKRLDLIEGILAHYDLEAARITPINYDRHHRTPYNNFLYRVDLLSPAGPRAFAPRAQQPCTAPPSAAGVWSLMVRLPNALSRGPDLTANRIQNQVAAMQIARDSLAKRYPCTHLARLVPRVFAWHAAGGPHDSGTGWIVMEYRAGEPLDESFAGMASLQRRLVLEELADVFTAVQGAALPEGVDRHGALAIAPNGQIVSAPWASWPTYVGFWASRMRAKLGITDGSTLLDGWRPRGIRAKVEAFIDEGIPNVLDMCGVCVDRLALVHGDITTSNFLYDPITHRLTALLDFDSAVVTHPAHEFLTSLSDVGGSSHAHDGDLALRAAVLTGCFDRTQHPPRDSGSYNNSSNNNNDAWIMARAWDNALADRGATRPCDVQGVVAIEALREVEEAICPLWVVSERMNRVRRDLWRLGAESTLFGRLERMKVVTTKFDQLEEKGGEEKIKGSNEMAGNGIKRFSWLV